MEGGRKGEREGGREKEGDIREGKKESLVPSMVAHTCGPNLGYGINVSQKQKQIT